MLLRIDVSAYALIALLATWAVGNSAGAQAGEALEDTEELPPGMRIDDEVPGRVVERREPVRPIRIGARLGVGGSLRLIEHSELQQDRLAPAYLEAQGSVVLPTRGALRHSALVSVSTNLEPDGSYLSGPDPFEQWVAAAGYGLHIGLGHPHVPQWVVGGHVAGALVATPDLTWGVELGLDAAYHILAGFGVYAEITGATFFGAEDRAGNLTVHPTLSLELGLTLDFELLP